MTWRTAPLSSPRACCKMSTDRSVDRSSMTWRTALAAIPASTTTLRNSCRNSGRIASSLRHAVKKMYRIGKDTTASTHALQAAHVQSAFRRGGVSTTPYAVVVESRNDLEAELPEHFFGDEVLPPISHIDDVVGVSDLLHEVAGPLRRTAQGIELEVDVASRSSQREKWDRRILGRDDSLRCEGRDFLDDDWIIRVTRMVGDVDDSFQRTDQEEQSDDAGKGEAAGRANRRIGNGRQQLRKIEGGEKGHREEGR